MQGGEEGSSNRKGGEEGASERKKEKDLMKWL